jgi:hypothetical protein
MAMRAIGIETERMNGVSKHAIIRHLDLLCEEEDDMVGFMDSFESAVTVPEGESFEAWCKRNRVESRQVEDEEYLMMSFLGLSPYIKSEWNRIGQIESTYSVATHLHGGEQEYLDFVQLLLSEGVRTRN